LARHRSRVSESDAGRRLDAVVAELPAVGTRALAERLVTGGAVLVDGRARPKSHRLSGGEELDVDVPEPTGLAPVELALDAVFGDEHLLVVDKPAGLVVHPSGPDERTTLAHGLLALGAAGGDPDRPGIVHRLDRDTSGLLLVARSEEAHRRLTEAIGRRQVERRYLALVRGAPRSRTGRITAPIGRDRRDRTRHSLDTATPREAVTWFEVVEPLGERALLDVRLETGRTHQIRVHLAHLKHPVVGDATYDGGRANTIRDARLRAAVARLGRPFLHAARLSFAHPTSGEVISFAAPLPAELEDCLALARAAV
jgi:23S rRNA pseudouridine1911/1915/1917 synthase